MNGPPPYLVRRLVWIPMFVVATVALVMSLPFWLLVAAFVSRFVPGRWRVLRLAWMLLVYLVLDTIVIVCLFLLWVASGFGWKLKTPRFQSAHYALAGWWLRRIVASARRTFNLVFRTDGVLATDGVISGAGGDRVELPEHAPLLVFSRHAGPGDSVLLVDAAINWMGRRPRLVVKDFLELEPVVDVVLNRLPNHFVPSTGPAGSDTIDAIADLAVGMGPQDCLVLFPEGANFTTSRQERAIERLRASGRPELADRAEAMTNLLPPKPTGALAAVDAAPDAFVAFIGHVGLERLSTIGNLWRGIPMDSTIVTRVWLVAPHEIPLGDERERWLYDRWAAMDAWIGEQVVHDSSSGR